MPYTPTAFFVGNVAVTNTTVYTVPTGTIAVLRYIHLVNQRSTSRDVNLWYGPSGSEILYFCEWPVAGLGVHDAYPYVALQAGWVVKAYIPTGGASAGDVLMTLSGDLKGIG